MWDDALSYIVTRDTGGGTQPFGLSAEARRQHLFMIGQTGTGKSTLIRNLIIQDIERGHGVGLIDPHGDLANEIIDCIPPHRTDHVVYFDPADHNYPVGLNVLRAGNGQPNKAGDINAVFGNVGTIVSFRVGEADATLLSRQFGDMPSSMFTDLGNYRVIVKSVTANGYSDPFRANTMRPLHIRSGRRHIVIARSRERFSTKREIIESRIKRWMGENISHKYKKRRKEKRF